MILIADHINHQTKRHFQGVVAELQYLGRFPHEMNITQHVSAPCKQRVALQIEVGHRVAIGIDVVLTTTSILLLAGFQEVQHRGVISELGIDGQRLHRHTYGMEEPLVSTSVVNSGEQCLLLVVILCQKIRVSCGEEGILIDTVGLAESLYLFLVNAKYPNLVCL